MHEPSATPVVEYAPGGDELGPEEAWRLVWWVGVVWCFGVVLSHAWLLLWAADDFARARAQSGWYLIPQIVWSMIAFVAIGLLAALLWRARRKVLLPLVAAVVVLALSLHLWYAISRHLFAEPDLLESAYYVALYTLSMLRWYGGCFLLVCVAWRATLFSARRLGTVVALLLLVWPVLDGFNVLYNFVSGQTLLELTERSWIIYHIQAAIFVAAALLALYGLRASPPLAPAIRMAGVLVVIGVILELAQYPLGYKSFGDTPFVQVPAFAGTLLAWMAPAAALFLWRQSGSRPLST
jgi:hypothetical protein